MRFYRLDEMARAVSVKTCGKCGQPIVDKNYYYYKGQYNHKGGCPASGSTPSASNTQTPASPNTAAPRQPAQQTTPAKPAGVLTQASNWIWLKRHGIWKYTVNEATGLVDVNQDVDLEIDNATKLPVQFGHVAGDFSVGGSTITTLEGCPRTIEGSFDCSNTDIRNFIGGPEAVGHSYQARNCEQLESLEGLPRRIKGTLTLIGSNKFTSLVGIPEHIGDLHLPASAWSGHHIHKLIKNIRNGIVIISGAEKTSSHWLGFLLIKGMRDGIEIVNPRSARKLEEIFNKTLRTRFSQNRAGNTAADPNQPPPLDYPDLLDVQEQLIDAGYTRLAKL